MTLYTIGHSTRSIEDFIVLLQAHGIRTLADIRAFPMSRRLPHFNREVMGQSLGQQSIQYIWMKELGGRRKKQLERKVSRNIGLRNESFRNYADYMLTDEFKNAAERLEQFAANISTAIMCAELLFFRCHRMLVSDYFALRGHEVLHIQDAKAPRPHQVTKEARLAEGNVIYTGDNLFE